MKRRNKYLTAGMERILREMREKDITVDRAPGAGWWLDCDQVSSRACVNLVRLALIHPDNGCHVGTKDTEYHVMTSDGEGCLDDPDYVPLMVREMRATYGKSYWEDYRWNPIL
jgi:hypothetical protein